MTCNTSQALIGIWIQAGNVIAVRLCAEYPNWAIHARNGYLVFDIDSDNCMYIVHKALLRCILNYDLDPVPIVPISIDATDKIPHRRNVTKWFEEAKTSQETALQLSLFIQAMNKFQLLPPEDQLSYFRIAGIHSYPPNVSWNMCKEPIPYDDPDMEKRMKNGEGGDYCAHNNFVFPTWHRAYMMLFEVGSISYPSNVNKLTAYAADNQRHYDGRSQNSWPSMDFSCEALAFAILGLGL